MLYRCVQVFRFSCVKQYLNWKIVIGGRSVESLDYVWGFLYLNEFKF